jgi:uroporphyrin-III C-methyltransferase
MSEHNANGDHPQEQNLSTAKQESAGRKANGSITWLAILLAITALLAVVFLWQQLLKQREHSSALSQQVGKLGDTTTQPDKTSALQSSIADLQKQVDKVSAMSAANTQALASANANLKDLAQNQNDITAAVDKIDSRKAQPEARTALLQVSSWLESANVALKLNHNVAGATLYLQSSLQTLNALPGKAISAVRNRLQSDIKFLSAIKMPDKNDILSRINQLSLVVGKLPIVPPKAWRHDSSSESTASKANASDSKKSNWHDIKSSLSGLKKLFVFRKVSDSEDAQLQPGQLSLVRNNVVQKLEQAAWAALYHSGALYHASLQSARSQINKNFLFASDQTKQIAHDIDQLLAIKIDPQVPALDSTIALVKKHLADTPELKKPVTRPKRVPNKRASSAVTPPGTNKAYNSDEGQVI